MLLNYKILNDISKNHGESFYILDSNKFSQNYIDLKNAFRSIYSNSHIAYSYKTNYIPKLCKIIDSLGGYAEIVSDMEYEIAKRIGVKPEKIIFNGPYKNPITIREILLSGGTINLDSIYELATLDEISDEFPNEILNVGIRCNFDINDGLISRFGFDVQSKDFNNVLSFINNKKNINFTGLHCHFSTRKLETWKTRTDGMIKLFNGHLGEVPKQIDLGGGLYGNMDESLKIQFDSYIPTYEEYANATAMLFSKHFYGETNPKLFIEPGSALVGDAMYFATKVINIKNIREKNIATLLGSIYNINPTLNKKNPPIKVYHCGDYNYYEDLDFGGYTCIESDYLYRNYTGDLGIGDYVVFGNVGSYSIVLKPPFILPNFAVIDINNTGHIELIKEKENFDDIFHTYKF